ncbi:MAG: DUF89 domain-containing protein [Promethearchaeota archaeon]
MSSARTGWFVRPYCGVCMLRTAYDVLCLATGHPDGDLRGDEPAREAQMEAVRRFFHVLQDFGPRCYPVLLASELLRIIREVTGNDDPFADAKRLSNEVALRVLPPVRRLVNSAGSPKERFKAAIMASIAGNNIDFVTGGHDFEVTEENVLAEVKRTLRVGLHVDHIDDLWSSIRGVGEVALLHDNAGELAFDTLVVEQLVALGVDVTCVVKGGPVANDATVEDARQVGLAEKVPVVTTGSDDLGFNLDRAGRDFLGLISRRPVLLAKGQSNLESFVAFRAHEKMPKGVPAFVALKLKCAPNAWVARGKVGNNAVVRFPL